MITLRVVGVTFRSNQEDIKRLAKDLKEANTSDVVFTPEPDNPYDNKAIQIIINGLFVGYVPADMIDVIKYLIDTNRMGTCFAYAVGGEEGRPNIGFRVKIPL